MAIDPARLLGWEFPELVHRIEPRDVMLYALAVGLGCPPTDRRQLPFVYEEGLKALPMMANVMGYRGFWLKDPATGVDWRKVLHVQQRIVLHAGLPVNGTIRSRQQVCALVDKGADKGAFIVTRREICDAGSGQLLAEVEQTNMLRGDGGFGTSNGTLRTLARVPDRALDHVVDLPVLEQAALLYRLCGDYNPLHADPEVARAAGFERPILHGLCTFAMVGHAILACSADYDASLLTMLEGRFSAPLYPGETLRTEIWDDRGGELFVRARAAERDVVVFDSGRATLGAAPHPPVS
ncbi:MULTISPECIES: MaoC/PaaZ C-terminal domain-containing protein [unclassified Sphingobium]|uniref:MaoC/PaaZ C-terminal domain-containing protein n=1 Tax=unclassified Sphingobium TaxID=2611147 RepID=UPI0035A6F5FF